MSNEETTTRAGRITEICEAIGDLCKAHAEHAIAAHEYRHSDYYPSEDEISSAWDHLRDTLEANL